MLLQEYAPIKNVKINHSFAMITYVLIAVKMFTNIVRAIYYLGLPLTFRKESKPTKTLLLVYAK